MYYTLENFIDYCENNDVATEGKLLDKIRSKVKQQCVRLIQRMGLKEMDKLVLCK